MCVPVGRNTLAGVARLWMWGLSSRLSLLILLMVPNLQATIKNSIRSQIKMEECMHLHVTASNLPSSALLSRKLSLRAVHFLSTRGLPLALQHPHVCGNRWGVLHAANASGSSLMLRGNDISAAGSSVSSELHSNPR